MRIEVMSIDIKKLKEHSLTQFYEDALENMSEEKIIQMLSEIQYLKKQLKTQSDVIDRLKQEAHHDPLTGLPNRRLFEHELTKAISYFQRYHRVGAVLLADTNDFKAINDTLGHLAGDAVLRHVGQILSGYTRSSDTVARIGGDEFAIILREVNAELAFDKACKLAELVSQTPCLYEGKEIYTSISIGGCCFTEATSYQELMEKADYAMYCSKNSKEAAFVA